MSSTTKKRPPAAWLSFGIVGAVASVFVIVACGSEREPLEEGPSAPDAAAVTDAGGDVRLCPSNSCLPYHLDCNGEASDGCEVNSRTDIANCGGCGIKCEEVDGSAPVNTKLVCIDGKCKHLCVDQPVGNASMPMRNCAGADPMFGDPIKGCPNAIVCDPFNCGECGVKAPVDSTGDRICFGGNPISSCPVGTKNCGNGACGNQCKNLKADPQNCGVCGRSCPDSSISPGIVTALQFKNIGFSCSDSKCVPVCASDPFSQWKDCDGDFDKTVADPTNPAFNGCELDTYHNKENCGACGKVCEQVCHTNPSSEKLEQVCDCPPGLTWCGSSCVDTKNDPRHCGSCTGVCLGPQDTGNGTPVCVESQCSYKCNAGFANCNKQIPDGCEVDIQNFPDHCGACGHKCEKDQRCGNGVCQVKNCSEVLK